MGSAKFIGRVGGLAVALGIGAGLAAAPWTAYATPEPGDGGGCSSTCSVGGHGTGGENSGGAAKGFNDKNLTFPEHPGELVTNVGTDFSGHLVATNEATGDTIGSRSGAFAPGIEEGVGHVTFGGGCNGRESRC